MKNLSESIMKNLKESADNDRIVKVRVDYADDSIELTEENIKKEIKKYLPNARIAVIHSKNGRWPEVEITDKYSDLKSYISDIYLGGFDEDQNIDDFLVESTSRNSRKVSKNIYARRIKESENLTARVTYHSEDGTRDYIAGRLSDGRYFLIGQQEQITVSDKDLPKLAKKDMDDFRYDEDGDREFIEALENGTTLDKKSDLAKIIINASRKHLDDGCYLLSESANVDVNNLTKEQLWKLRQEIVLGSVYTHDYDNSFGIDPSAVCGFFDSFIEDSQVDDLGKPIDREVEEYDNAEDLYNYYRSCENPFGEIESINEKMKNLSENIMKNLKEAVSAMDIANEIMNININPSEWNNASQSERDAMVYEPLKSIVRKYRKELVDDYDCMYNLNDVERILTGNNFHTECDLLPSAIDSVRQEENNSDNKETNQNYDYLISRINKIREIYPKEFIKGFINDSFDQALEELSSGNVSVHTGDMIYETIIPFLMADNLSEEYSKILDELTDIRDEILK